MIDKLQFYSTMARPIVYRSVESVLDFLNKNKDASPDGVSQLIQTYNDALNVYKTTTIERNFPLIILEGLDGCGKSTTGKKLANKINAQCWSTPPASIKPIRSLFDDHPLLRQAYYALGNYIAALEVAVILNKSPVVMDRYWHSTCAFEIAQKVNDHPNQIQLPPKGDQFYEWPGDLLKPDRVIFLHVEEPIRLSRLSRRTSSTTQEELLKASETFRNNIITAYRNMVNPGVDFINGGGTFKMTLQKINDNIKSLINKN